MLSSGVRQDHVRAVIADSALLSSMEMYAFLLRPGLSALDNLADKLLLAMAGYYHLSCLI